MEADLQEQRELKKKLSMSVVKGIIDKATFDELKQECIDQIEGIEEYLNVLGVQEMKSEFFWLLSRNLLLDISTAWMRGTVDQRQMFQKILFPNGLMYSQTKGILNTDKECLFSKLEEFMSDYLSLASRRDLNPCYRRERAYWAASGTQRLRGFQHLNGMLATAYKKTGPLSGFIG